LLRVELLFPHSILIFSALFISPPCSLLDLS